MATTMRAVGHEDKLSLVEHLDELRSRLVICLVVFIGATALCFWQNNFVLDILTRPLEESAVNRNSGDPLEQTAVWQLEARRYFVQQGRVLRIQAAAADTTAERTQLIALARQAERVASLTPDKQGRRPVTLSVGEPFTVTLKVAAYAGLLLSLPLLLFQAYAFILPAFSRREKQAALPIMVAVPFLFIAGVAFGWLMVLPPAISFLQNFNDDSYDVLIQAKDYYSFSIMLLGAMGLLFQIPVGLLGLTRTGIVTTRQLSQGRRYAFLVIAVIAMVLPGQDPVTMMLMMVPMYVLYEASILISWISDRRARKRAPDVEPEEIEPDEE